jgi:putative spermidine/putrescine transport system substrate-binding protein
MPMQDSPSRLISRRRVVASAAAATLAMPLVFRPRRARANNNLVFVTWGGTYKSSVVAGLIKPFQAATGITVTVVDTPDLAKVKAQMMTGNVAWDVFDAPGAMGASGSRDGFWEPLDPAMFKSDDLSVPPPTKDLAPFYTWAGGVAYDPKRFPDGKHPRNFAEDFDAKTFPGRRTFRNRISETLEAALLASGVPGPKLYPLDVERGFKMLDAIKPHVVKWIESTPETITMLQQDEADFSYSYASRVKTTRAAGGVPVDFSFGQTLNGLEYLAVLKGAPNKEAAMKFVAFALQAQQQAAVMNLLGNAPANKRALPMMSAEARRWLPDLSLPQNVVLNDMWWADNFDKLNRRFLEWIIS